MKCFSVYDKAVGAYARPFYEVTRASAVRAFSDACNEKDSNLRKHAEDYILYECGSFDDVLGIFEEKEPQKVITALECVMVEAERG